MHMVLLAAFPVSGRCVLFPSCFVARAVLAGVRLSSCVPSVSPVVAAVRFRLAPSQRLALPLARLPGVNQADNYGDDEDRSQHPPKSSAPPAAALPPRGTAPRFAIVARHAATVARRWMRQRTFAREKISLSARGGEENETNSHEPPMRTTPTRLRLVSTCVPTKSVRSLSESLHAHNHEARNRRTSSLVERWLPRADAVARAWLRGAFSGFVGRCW